MTAPLSQQARAGRLGGLTRWDKATAAERAQQGRRGQEGLRQRFERELRAEGVTEPQELARRLDIRVRLHFARLGQARAGRKAQRGGSQ